MGRAEGEGRPLRVEVVQGPAPGRTERVVLALPEGATLADALAASGLPWHSGGEAAAVGIWGRVQALDTPLRDLDRVEIYRPLRVDPKEARRLRYKGARRARSR